MTVKQFNFSNSTIKSTADYEAAITPIKKDNSKVFKPGLHEVTVGNVQFMGEGSDSTWTKVSITLKGPGEKTIRDLLMIPHKDLMYKSPGKNPTMYPFKRLKDFILALGTEITPENAGTVLDLLFSKPTNLEGLNVKAKIGYKGTHVTYSGKDANGNAAYNVTLGNGSLLADTSGATLVFADRDSAAAHLNSQGVSFVSFPEVLGYELSSTPNSISPDTKW